MLAIAWKDIQKNTPVLIAFTLFALGLALVFGGQLPQFFGEEGDVIDTDYPLLVGIFIAMLVFSGLMSVEKEEDQNHGYEFLKTLPVSDEQIVLGKFMATLINSAFGVMLLWVLLGSFTADLAIVQITRSYILIFAGISLLLVAGLYPLAFRWGYSRIMPLVLGVYIAVLMLPQLIYLFLAIITPNKTFNDYLSTLSIPAGLVVLTLGLIGFGLFAWRAIGVKEKLP